MPTSLPISEARMGDVVRFKSFALRIEREPVVSKGRVHLYGRISIDGCPTVARSYLADTIVKIER